MKLFNRISEFLKKENAPVADPTTETEKPEEFERCVICGALTSIKVNTPIELRNNYEIGFGQLCADCKKKFSGN